MRLKLKYGFLTALTLAASIAWADTLQLKNGSLIKGKFLGGTATEISFQVGSTVQKYNVADIVSLKFDSEGGASAAAPQQSSLPDDPGTVAHGASALAPHALSSLPDDPATLAHVEVKPAFVT